MQRIKQFFNGENSLRGATVILIITLLISNILGLLRDHFLAQKIPIDLLDTYYAAFRIPDMVFNLLILGAIAAALVPIFSSYLAKKEIKIAWQVVNSFINISLIVLVFFILVLAILMPYLIPLLVPDFAADKQDLTIKLARLMLISPLLFSISYILGGVLNSFKRFLAYSIAPLFYNLSIIVATLLFADKISVWAPVFGVIIGAFLHMLVQIPTAISLGWRPAWIFDWKHPGIIKIVRLMIPRAIGLGATQIMLLFYTAIASSLGAGSIAIFNLADNIQTMPTVVFGTSFATAVFPRLSEAVSLGKREDFANHIWRSARAILFILIPAGVGIILLRAQIIRLILGSGYFGWQQTIDTANTLGWFAIALFAQGLVPLLARAFYALHNSRIPMTVSIFAMIISIVLGIVLAPKIGVLGLALAFSVGGIFNALALYIILRKFSPEIKKDERSMVVFLAKVLLSSLIMALVIQVAKYGIEPFVDMERFWGVLVQASGAILIGVIFYLGLSWILKCEEIKEVLNLFKRRFKT